MKQGTLLSHLRAPDNETIVVCALPSELPEVLPETVLISKFYEVEMSKMYPKMVFSHF